jgi:RNA 3'-phosphate cyclase
MIELDGAYLEGGGQILRTAVGLSAVTGKACRIVSIRKGREKPGLQPQHLHSIQGVAQICRAELIGARLHASEIEFRPGELDPADSLTVQIGTAGSVTLALQSLMIPLVRLSRPLEIVVTGGTHVPWSPPWEYFESVFCWFLTRMGCRLKPRLKRYGFYPRGGGRVEVRIEPGRLQAHDWLQRGELERTEVTSIATRDLRHANVAERQIDGARRRIDFDDERALCIDAASTGTAIFAVSRFENSVMGGSALGRLGKPAEKVGRECADNLLEQVETDACLDEHMADQILPFMALAGEDSTVSVSFITDHCRTNMWVIEQFLPVKFEVDEERRLITCRHGA